MHTEPHADHWRAFVADDPLPHSVVRLLADVPGLRITPVGSRVTCVPPPDDTDRDYLVYVPGDQVQAIIDTLRVGGWNQGGSKITDDTNLTPEEGWFFAYRLDEVNLIVTMSVTFEQRFLVATSVAMGLNLIRKEDRIGLFQAILYGRPWRYRILPSITETLDEVAW